MIYIKHDIKGFYVELNNELSQIDYQIGTTWEDFLSNKWVPLSSQQITFHNLNPTAKISEVWNMQLNPTYQRTLDNAKNEMINKIDNYDRSDRVNSFTINNSITAWFTIEERLNYQRSVDAALSQDENAKLSFFVGDTMLEVKASLAGQMLSQIQLYADACFIATKQHKIAVQNLTTIEEVDNYDYQTGYPLKLSFNLV